MIGLALVLATLEVAPLRDAADLEHRLAVAEAIAAVTDDPRERAILLVTAAEESAWRRDVADCRVRGDNGRARGAWQIHPRSSAEARAACTLDGGAALALERVRESLRACGPGPAGLAAYCSGRCDRGVRISARRLRFAARF